MVGGKPPDERTQLLKELETRLSQGEMVIEELRSFVSANQDLDYGWLLLARSLVFSSPEEANGSLDHIKAPNKLAEEIKATRDITDLMTCDLPGSLTGDKLKAARESAQFGDIDQTLKSLVDAVMIDKSVCNEMPRRATIALFHLLGDQHELTKKYRRRFDMALY